MIWCSVEELIASLKYNKECAFISVSLTQYHFTNRIYKKGVVAGLCIQREYLSIRNRFKTLTLILLYLGDYVKSLLVFLDLETNQLMLLL